ncbi:uncharacterized protein DUF2750 [Lacibacter cauensis]|uniref:Uncharacterized protein DUF2750 n=1 Tax=Lacibacter cauensis TaxID=510947 RepID=A0A562SX39_9BACT|nr:DUF2750 domain-containing protein [Lacibacter cauensis]TWI85330.1 uncharacterized protein DUF2750 [Lacibacter cauensis]
MNQNKLINIENLSPKDRYGYFIRKVADFQEVWFIQDNDRYLMVGDNDDRMAIPVWPEKDFAELMLKDDWKNYKITSMEMVHFLEWLDTIEKKGYKIAAFPYSDLKSVMVTAKEMKAHLLYEMEQYE